MALDLQQRSAQHDHRWDNTRYETENGSVVLQAEPIKNGGLPLNFNSNCKKSLFSIEMN